FVSCRAVLIFSLIIEFSQMFFCLGTFQLADIVYNTSGGIIGGLIYLMCYGIVRAIKKNRH
ncbi:MAG: VanZ family protein, partial [Clostridia bacterium]|nr:VanZ family protein [Clostridia bacterium]